MNRKWLPLRAIVTAVENSVYLSKEALGKQIWTPVMDYLPFTERDLSELLTEQSEDKPLCSIIGDYRASVQSYIKMGEVNTQMPLAMPLRVLHKGFSNLLNNYKAYDDFVIIKWSLDRAVAHYAKSQGIELEQLTDSVPESTGQPIHFLRIGSLYSRIAHTAIANLGEIYD